MLMDKNRTKTLGTAGIDEAGRGPMIGPMVICGVLLTDEKFEALSNIKVRDSKLLSRQRRENLYEEIKDVATEISIREVSARDIDEGRTRGVSLNDMEVDAFSFVLRALRPKLAYIDAADVIPKRFGESVLVRSGLPAHLCEVISEHKADSRYPIVSAASIVAKVERDRRIDYLKEVYGDLGSGYPTDPKSIAFIKTCIENQEIPEFVRTSWKSVKRFLKEFNWKQEVL